jgi:hypothetical protein
VLRAIDGLASPSSLKALTQALRQTR